MSPKTEHTTVVEDRPTAALDIKETTTNHQLVPVHQPADAIPSIECSTLGALSALDPLPKARIRLGKIARLPRQYRDMVNRMLRNNCPAINVVAALDEFGITVTQRNISNWKTRGGYAQWCHEEDQAAQLRLLQDNLLQYLRKEEASQIPEVGLQLAASHISRFLLQPEALQQLIASPEKYSRVVATLCRVAGQIHTLQKYRNDCASSLGYKHNPELVRRESEQEIETVRKTSSSTLPQRASDDPIPHRNFMPAEGFSERPLDRPRTLHPDPRNAELETLKGTLDAFGLFRGKSDGSQNGPPPARQ